MNTPRLIRRGLWFYRRTHLGVVLGAALATTVLTGALMVGDSVRHSLGRLTGTRLGRTDFVLLAEERFFAANLAERMQQGGADRECACLPPCGMGVSPMIHGQDARATTAHAEGCRSLRIVPVLLLDGVALSPDGDRRVNAVQVVAVDDAFWSLAPEPLDPPALADGACRINAVLAERLGLSGSGDTLVLRLRKPGGLPTDLTLATRDHDDWARRLRVDGVQSPDAFGLFTLRTTQSPPPTIFVRLSWLSAQLDIPDRANVLLIDTDDESVTVDSLHARLDATWRLADAGLRLAALPDGGVELLSDHVFIPPAVAATATRIWEDVRPVTTYFLNRIEAGDRVTPYSFATAPGPPRVPAGMADDEVLINDWLAEDLEAAPGTLLTLAYYAVDAGGQLAERTADLRVGGIIAADDVSESDRGLTPHIPGLSDVENCRDWDPGIPIDLDRIRDRDEAYWNAYGPLPKLYLTRATAERLWRNRFGVHTALRFHGPDATLERVISNGSRSGIPARPGQPGMADLLQASGNGNDALYGETVGARLRDGLSARELGFAVQAAREAGLAASREAVDFGQLFVGLSFFLIVAAILLTTLLFAFSMEQRAGETGTLLALGLPTRQVARMRLAEGIALVLIGTVVGTLLAVGYNHLILLALQTIWRDAVRVSTFAIHVRPVTVLIGITVILLAAVASIGWVIRGQMRLTVRELLHREPDPVAVDRRPGRWALAAGMLTLLAAAGIAVTASPGQGRDAAGAFFASGSLLLAGLLTLAYGGMGRVRQAASDGIMTAGLLPLRSAAYRHGRSLACLALMALGVFLVVAVAANRRGTVRDPAERSSGTGGWLLWGQTTLPLVHDLNADRGRARFGLSPAQLVDTTITQLRLREGDDASCLNLNRVTTPHLLGVDPEAWDHRGAFSFARLAAGVDRDHPWRALAQAPTDDRIPAFADMADITWGLGKAVGDTLDFTDEQGRAFQLELIGGLAPSILQGHLIVSERHLMERFPSLGGARILLVDAPAEQRAELERLLTRRLEDLGLAIVPTAHRLAEFNTVENTYLSIFMLLGGLGVLLGSAGLGVVAARNILERRSELALLRAVGFRRARLRRLVFCEHALLALGGIVTGALAAGLAVTPALLAPETIVPWTGLLVTLGTVLAGSLAWIGLAVAAALRGSLIDALRNE